MAISIRLNDADSDIIKSYAALKGMSVSELVRTAILERIEDEFDLKAYEAAMAEHQSNPVTYSLEEIEKELGLRK